MGQITIEIPQKLTRTYRIVSEDSAEEFLSYLQQLAQKNEIIEIINQEPISEE
jgi:hypothetical protein